MKLKIYLKNHNISVKIHICLGNQVYIINKKKHINDKDVAWQKLGELFL